MNPETDSANDASDTIATADLAPIRFDCTACSKSLEAGPDMAGASILCPSCNANVQVPLTSGNKPSHPYRACERGQNEQVNGLLRKFFPKGRDLRDVTQEEIDRAAHLINTRPRKVLNYRTPDEVLHEELRRVAFEN